MVCYSANDVLGWEFVFWNLPAFNFAFKILCRPRLRNVSFWSNYRLEWCLFICLIWIHGAWLWHGFLLWTDFNADILGRVLIFVVCYLLCWLDRFLDLWKCIKVIGCRWGFIHVWWAVKDRNEVFIMHLFKQLLIWIFLFGFLNVAWHRAELRFWSWLDWLYQRLDRLDLLFFRCSHAHHFQEVQIKRRKRDFFFLLCLRNAGAKIGPIVIWLFGRAGSFRSLLKRWKLVIGWVFLLDKLADNLHKSKLTSCN